MKLLRKVLVPVAGVAVVSLVLLLAGPRAAHALAATLVQVTNTPLAPVPNADVNTPGDEPFQTHICASFPTGSFPCASTTPESFAVPSITSDGFTVKRLVIENISGFCGVSGEQGITLVQLGFSTSANTVNGLNLALLVPTMTSIGSNTQLFRSTVPTPVYADPESNVYFASFNYLNPPSSTQTAGCDYNIIGHLVTH
jgi:hypothetical protein